MTYQRLRQPLKIKLKMDSTMGNTASTIFASAQPPFPSRGEWGASPAHNLFMNNANSIFYYHLDKGTNHQRQKHHLYLPSRGQVHLHREPNMKLLPARKACGKVENLHATDLQRSSGDTLKGQGPQWRNRSALGDEIWKWPEPHRHGLRRQEWRLLQKNRVRQRRA